MKQAPKYIKDFVQSLEESYRGLDQDINSIRHSLRAVQRRQDALLVHFGISLASDFIEETVNPSGDFINRIIQEARFAAPVVKSKRKKR